MDEMENTLNNIHSKLKFIQGGNLRTELPEQLMIAKHLLPTDVVLELGGSIGRASCVINYILDNKKNHVVVEPHLGEVANLKHNRDLNSFGFQIEESAISSVPLYSRGWHTYKQNVAGRTQVKTITYNELKQKYNLNFTVLVIDNEGNFVDTLKDYPEILDNIRLLQIEHDFNTNDDLNFFNDKLLSSGFNMEDKYLKTEKYGPGMNWSDGLQTDPIFVSTWKRL